MLLYNFCLLLNLFRLLRSKWLNTKIRMMKRTTLLIIGVLVAATTLMAQEENAEAKTADRAKERTERLRSELNLSQEQADQLYASHSRYSEERKAVREATRKELVAQRDQMRTLMRSKGKVSE